ncbi:uncharacterized protein [Drosophila pseudoobscura]|uniref:Uncharacterized protein n=1 Tax=Drosophila pseudoobscura pseudoobscura TaxID=46245 RepID=Q29G12_DROPS|nr:uncharacterized protein LOC4814282 [Drosophila pseudoobscura]
MCKLSLSLCLLIALFGCLAAASPARQLPLDSSTLREITVVKNVRLFAAQHPGLKIQRLAKQPATARGGVESVRYTLGARVTSDSLVAQGADVFSYPASQDVSVQLTYPEEGAGAIVTYVELICTQDNSEGNAYVVAGGIGQRFISIILEASQTRNFSYQAQYYGQK